MFSLWRTAVPGKLEVEDFSASYFSEHQNTFRIFCLFITFCSWVSPCPQLITSFLNWLPSFTDTYCAEILPLLASWLKEQPTKTSYTDKIVTAFMRAGHLPPPQGNVPRNHHRGHLPAVPTLTQTRGRGQMSDLTWCLGIRRMCRD